jgi:hypothetical protein
MIVLFRFSNRDGPFDLSPNIRHRSKVTGSVVYTRLLAEKFKLTSIVGPCTLKFLRVLIPSARITS